MSKQPVEQVRGLSPSLILQDLRQHEPSLKQFLVHQHDAKWVSGL